MGETAHTARPASLQRSHTLSTASNFMITDLDTGVASTLHNTAWIDKGFDPIDMAVPAPSAIRRRRSKPPLHPTNDVNQNTPGKQVSKTASRLRRKNSRRPKVRLDAASAQSLGVSVKVDAHKKRTRHFSLLVRIQQVKAHNGAVRALAFSKDGKYLATAGQDAIVNVYLVESSLTPEMKKDNGSAESSRTTSTDSREPEDSDSSRNESLGMSVATVEDKDSRRDYLCKGTPLRRYHGHTQDVVDLDWSKTGFLLSASMDMTVLLWHPDSSLCLRKFVHTSFVTSVTFHPNDENIFISGGLDGAVRLWHVFDQKQLSITHTGQYVTASAISKDGKTGLIGTYHGHCKFYSLYDQIANEWSLKYTTQLDVRSRRAKSNPGKKIAGFTFLPKGDKFVVSSNDSRLRVYRMDDKALVAKFSGHENESSQLKGSISPCGKFLLCGSQDSSVVIWDTHSSTSGSHANGNDSTCEETDPANTGHRERNARYEKFVPFEHDQVSAAVFAPRPAKKSIRLAGQKEQRQTRRDPAVAVVIVAASQNGYLRVFQNGAG